MRKTTLIIGGIVLSFLITFVVAPRYGSYTAHADRYPLYLEGLAVYIAVFTISLIGLLLLYLFTSESMGGPAFLMPTSPKITKTVVLALVTPLLNFGMIPLPAGLLLFGLFTAKNIVPVALLLGLVAACAYLIICITAQNPKIRASIYLLYLFFVYLLTTLIGGISYI